MEAPPWAAADQLQVAGRLQVKVHQVGIVPAFADELPAGLGGPRPVEVVIGLLRGAQEFAHAGMPPGIAVDQEDFQVFRGSWLPAIAGPGAAR